MIPERFRYARARDVAEAIALLAQAPDARILAGGHSLLPLMKLRLAHPPLLVDLERVEALRAIALDGDTLVVGAMVRYRDLGQNPLVQRHAPLLAAAAATVGDPQVRNRGTVGGAICHADPAGDLLAAALALEAEVDLRSASSQRRLPVQDFLKGPLATDLSPGEMLTAVRLLRRDGWGYAYRKFPHPASGYAVAGAACLLRRAGERVERCHLALTGVGPLPYRARAAEAQLTGQAYRPALLNEAAQRVTDGVEVQGDRFASAEYRRHLAQVVAEEALAAAWNGAGAG